MPESEPAPLDPSVIDRLRCPKSGQKLVPAPEVILSRLGQNMGFCSEDGEWFYPVEEGFPVITAEAAMEVSTLELDWDSTYQSGTTPWDKGEPAPPLVQFIEDGGKLPGKVFVPGCGRGHDARYLAKSGVEVTALDISPTAIADAEKLAVSEGVEGIRFVVGDLFNLPEEFVGAFDWVVEHTCLSGLPPIHRPAYFESIASLLRPNGQFFAIWFINPDMDPGESGPPFGIKKSEVAKFTADKFELVRDWIPERAFEGREGRELVQILRRK